MKGYMLQLVQHLKPDHRFKRCDFCVEIQADMEAGESATRLIFSDESTFHLSGKVKRHNARIWGTEIRIK
jgi:hypothetical protein